MREQCGLRGRSADHVYPTMPGHCVCMGLHGDSQHKAQTSFDVSDMASRVEHISSVQFHRRPRGLVLKSPSYS